MFGVTGLAEIETIRADGRVVGVVLMTGFDISALTWLVDVWGEIHRKSGHRWHLIAPTRLPINDDTRLVSRENYDVVLAEDLARLYGLSNRDLPCIVLDTFNEDERQLRIALPPSETDRRRLLEDIGNFINSANDTPTRSPDLTRSLYDHLKVKGIQRALIGWVPKLGSIGLRAASSSF